MKVRLLICLMSLVFASAVAPVLRAQDCADLARVIARESEKTGDIAQIDILRKSQFCSAKYQNASSEQRAQIEASYGLFSGGASGSSEQIQQKQESECESQYGSYWSNQIKSAEIERVSSVEADVVRACLQSRSFRLVDLTITNEALVAAFRYGGAGETINGVILTPTNVADCSVLLDGAILDLSKVVGKNLASGSTLSLQCTRRADPESSTADQKHYKGGILGVATKSDQAQFPLIDYSVPPLPQPVAQALSNDLTELRKELTKYSTKTDSTLKDLTARKIVCTATRIAGNTAKCPDVRDVVTGCSQGDNMGSEDINELAQTCARQLRPPVIG